MKTLAEQELRQSGRMKRTFRALTRNGKSEYVDWYDVETIEDARKLWELDRKEFGLPDTVTVEIVEVNPNPPIVW